MIQCKQVDLKLGSGEKMREVSDWSIIDQTARIKCHKNCVYFKRPKIQCKCIFIVINMNNNKECVKVVDWFTQPLFISQ